MQEVILNTNSYDVVIGYYKNRYCVYVLKKIELLCTKNVILRWALALAWL